MHMKLTVMPVIWGVLFVFSCSGNKDDKPKEDTVFLRTEVKNADPNAQGGDSCLLGYADKLDKLLPLNAAATFTQLSANTAKVAYSKVMKNREYHSIKYSWVGDRKRNMKDMGINMELPVKNQIELHGVKKNTLAKFKMSHRAPTVEELKQRDKAVNDAFDGKSGNKGINEKVEKLDRMKVDKSAQKGVAQNLGDMFEKVAMAYEDVQGLADAASWNSFERRLYVLDNGVEISLTVDLSADEAVNREKAIYILKQLLLKCD